MTHSQVRALQFHWGIYLTSIELAIEADRRQAKLMIARYHFYFLIMLNVGYLIAFVYQYINKI